MQRASTASRAAAARVSKQSRKSMAQCINVKVLPPARHQAKDHHIGKPPTSFDNPWPSYRTITTWEAFRTRFGNGSEKNFVEVPQGPNGQRSDELVKVRKPAWAANRTDCLRATWIGHASFLVETPAAKGASRGVRLLFDPVWSERTSPVGFFGPKRYTPVPCTIEELPQVDIVAISHNHYDHLDYQTIVDLYRLRKGKIHFVVGLGTKSWFTQHIGCSADEVTELDWWDAIDIAVADVGSASITCCPTQHASRRTGLDGNKALWCSYALKTTSPGGINKSLYFAGDTAYQAVSTPSACPAFAEIGETLGSFDLALLPIGLMTPASFMGSVHATPEQSLRIHADVRSRLSIGMHYGTVRGGISAQYEDVRDPARRWRAAAEKEGKWAGGGVEGDGGSVDGSVEGGVGLCDVGETVCV